MITFQDFIKLKNNGLDGIKDIITTYQCSEEYNNAITADKYYQGENIEILNRMQWFFNSQGLPEIDKFKANNQIPCNFYKKITKQEIQYLLGNGITLEDNIKKLLGKNIDILLQRAGLNAKIHGVTWLYCFINNNGKFDLVNFKATEFVPLWDELTGELKAGIRFFQIDINKPMIIEVYEEDGRTILKNEKNKMEIVEDKKPYKIKVKKDFISEEQIGMNWNTLPLVAYWGDETHKTSLTPSLKNKIDLYDIIMSDFGNNLEDNNDVYWVLKNYRGQDMSEFLADYKYFKMIKTDDDGEANIETIDTPYEAREVALNILRTQIYEDSMALDIKAMTGGSLTNVAINSAKTDLDLKTDEFEWNTVEAVEGILKLLSEYKNVGLDEEIKFIRRTITNDTEVIENIYRMRNDLDLKTALKLNPYIDDSEVDEIVKALDNEDEISYNRIRVNNQDTVNNSK